MIWDDASHQAFKHLLSPSGKERLKALKSNLRVRKLAMRSLLALSVTLVVVQAILRPTGQWVLPKEALAYGVGILGFWILGVAFGATLTLREVFGYAIFGFFVGPILTELIASPLHSLAGPKYGTGIVVPIIEELVKAIPALMLALSMRRDVRGSRILYDFLLVGFASGAGFALHEDILWKRVLLAEGPLKLVAPWIYNEPPYLTGSHATWAALTSAGIGVLFLFRRKAFGWVFGGVVFAVGLIEHMAWNYWGGHDFLALLGYGRLPLVLFYVIVAAGCLHAVIVRTWAASRDQLFPKPELFDQKFLRRPLGKLEYKRLLMQAHAASMGQQRFGLSRGPSVPAAERLVIAATDAEVLYPVAPIPAPPQA